MKVEEFKILKTLLIQYKVLTAKIIEILEDENFASLESSFQLRENIIEKINIIDFDTSDFKVVCEEVSLLPLQKKLTLLMNEKKAKLNKEISNFENLKVANRSYNKSHAIDSLFFNKKI